MHIIALRHSYGIEIIDVNSSNKEVSLTHELLDQDLRNIFEGLFTYHCQIVSSFDVLL